MENNEKITSKNLAENYIIEKCYGSNVIFEYINENEDFFITELSYDGFASVDKEKPRLRRTLLVNKKDKTIEVLEVFI